MKKTSMKTIVLATLFSAISATSVQAIENQKTVCSHGNQTRVIEVVYSTESETPCEVHYSKEEGMTIPWSANNLAGFCEEKAAAFIDKQETWGWACEAATSAMAEEPVSAPMTEEPMAEEAVTEEAVTEEAVTEEAVTEEAVTEEPMTTEG